MLGVLAIIGLLSVGAIAGYSKAMEKYQWNKFTYDISSIAMSAKLLIANEKQGFSGLPLALNATNSLGNFYIGSHITPTLHYSPDPGFRYMYLTALDEAKISMCFYSTTISFCKKMLQTPFEGLDWKLKNLGGILVIERVSIYHKFQQLPTLYEIDNACRANDYGEVSRVCLYY